MQLQTYDANQVDVPEERASRLARCWRQENLDEQAVRRTETETSRNKMETSLTLTRHE